MRRVNIFCVAVLSIFLFGCNLRAAFQPLPPMFENWEKRDSSDDEIKKSLLDCGYENPYTGFSEKVPLNTNAKGSLCMKKKGFRYLLGPIICEQKGWPSIPACEGRPCTSADDLVCRNVDLGYPQLKPVGKVK
ncbi:hypothetical protein [Herbaspirillum rhizosphaerae]|uniref:hypothetical protein n=1 Tax=Herbaspirillum rhizosphaerae TaxID=346179 RepID=UPI0012EEDFDF|nr:hypothetical protein [Herbaspirillum rhizosphaerae]